MSTEHYSMSQILSDSQAVMAQIMQLAGKESIAAGKSADTQLSIVNQGYQAALDADDKEQHLYVLSAVVTGISGVMQACGSFGGLMAPSPGVASSIAEALDVVGKGAMYVALPVTKGALEIVESNAQKDLGDTQKSQVEIDSAGKMVQGQDQLIMSAAGDSAEQTQEMARQLSQMISNQKQASMSR